MVNWGTSYIFLEGPVFFFSIAVEGKNILDAIPNISQLNLDT